MASVPREQKRKIYKWAVVRPDKGQWVIETIQMGRQLPTVPGRPGQRIIALPEDHGWEVLKNQSGKWYTLKMRLDLGTEPDDVIDTKRTVEIFEEKVPKD